MPNAWTGLSTTSAAALVTPISVAAVTQLRSPQHATPAVAAVVMVNQEVQTDETTDDWPLLNAAMQNSADYLPIMVMSDAEAQTLIVGDFGDNIEIDPTSDELIYPNAKSFGSTTAARVAHPPAVADCTAFTVGFSNTFVPVNAVQLSTVRSKQLSLDAEPFVPKLPSTQPFGENAGGTSSSASSSPSNDGSCGLDSGLAGTGDEMMSVSSKSSEDDCVEDEDEDDDDEEVGLGGSVECSDESEKQVAVMQMTCGTRCGAQLSVR